MQQVPMAVQVRSRYQEGHWSRGFEVTEIVRRREREAYRLRRRSDGVVLPVLFDPDEVRADTDA